jgi:hypothetical protein
MKLSTSLDKAPQHQHGQPRLQRGARAGGQRHAERQTAGEGERARDAQRNQVDQYRAQRDSGQQARPQREHGGQRDAGGQEQRRGVGGAQRHLQPQAAGHDVNQQQRRIGQQRLAPAAREDSCFQTGSSLGGRTLKVGP